MALKQPENIEAVNTEPTNSEMLGWARTFIKMARDIGTKKDPKGKLAKEYLKKFGDGKTLEQRLDELDQKIYKLFTGKDSRHKEAFRAELALDTKGIGADFYFDTAEGKQFAGAISELPDNFHEIAFRVWQFEILATFYRNQKLLREKNKGTSIVQGAQDRLERVKKR